MFKKIALASVFGLLTMGSALADVGAVTYISNASPGPSYVLPGQNGNPGTAYNLGVIGTPPPGITLNNGPVEAPLYGNGTNLDVNLSLTLSSLSFNDYITFTVPTASTTTGISTTFDIRARNNILSSFSAFRVRIYNNAMPSGTNPFSAINAMTPFYDVAFTGLNQINNFVEESFSGVVTGPGFMWVSGTAIGTNPLYNIQLTAAPIPEPGTYAMLLAGLAAVSFVAKRRSAK